MANYKDLEYEFVERTLALIEQYEIIKHKFKFEEQYNHTLLINCLLGLVVMPKERVLSVIPTDRLTQDTRKKMGIEKSVINGEIVTVRDLVIALRHSVAHFHIEARSTNEKNHIDVIVFSDERDKRPFEIIQFRSEELLAFVRYYGNWLLANLKDRL